jgi:hypothetical protein
LDDMKELCFLVEGLDVTVRSLQIHGDHRPTHPPPSHCRLPGLFHRPARCLQPQRPPCANSGPRPLLPSVPPHQFPGERRPRQPQRLLNADFVLKPRRCLSLADDALSLPLVIIHHLLLPVQIRVEPGVMWRLYDGRCTSFTRTYRRGSGGNSASPFRRWLAVATTLVIILAEDVEHERGRTCIGSIVVGTAIVTICDLWGGRVCDRGVPGVSCMMYWSFMPLRRSRDPISSCVAGVGLKDCTWGNAKLVCSIERRLVLRGRRLLNGFDDRLRTVWRGPTNRPRGASLERGSLRRRCHRSIVAGGEARPFNALIWQLAGWRRLTRERGWV